MRTTRSIAVVLIAFFLVGCATVNRLPENYSGPDAGYLVVSLGSAPTMKLSSYTLYFQKKDDARQGHVYYAIGTERDFDDTTEHGFVDIQKLPAGNYELVNFQAYRNLGVYSQSYWSAKTPFAIPFKIEPGIATYIGDYMAVGIDGTNFFGMRVLATIYFVVTDKQSRDIPIARKKEPLINTIQIAVPDVIQIGHPLIKAKVE